uniref:NEDD8-activating enzyme E1 regulatory subunit-like n=1 Tax=Styela clava TaxID=7725 RepID=UPI001939391B|nr:NEDD8-activating enzyme E1 regulatory subunit-like [Styela clava]
MDKQQKYDRQLRLWGDHGQRSLENAKVCLINVTATGTEMLKNMVLPGIGSFTIIDSKCVTGEDAGNNFFLHSDRIGDSRAKVATELLLELNPDVSGEYMDETIDQLLENNPKLFSHFTVVIVSGLIPEDTLKKLSLLLWGKNIPLVLCKSYGFIGYSRLIVQEHCVVESHPDNTHEDLRLDNPFPGLKNYCDSLDLDVMTYKEHSHVPYVVLLYKYLEKWKKDKGEMPTNWKEKTAFKKLLLSGVRMKESESGIIEEEEENFLEAAKHANASLVASRIPSAVQKLLNDEECLNLKESSKNFWILVRGLKMFFENEGNGMLPLRGTLPDMTSDSERYIKLQSVYKEQAELDTNAVTEHVSEICASLNSRNGRISEKEIRRFCKNSHFLRTIRCRSLEKEFQSPSKSFVESLIADPDSNAVWYVMFRSVERFQARHGRYPGTNELQLETDIGKLKICMKELLEEWGVPGSSELVKDDYIHEMTRCGAAELHAVASFMGGIVAHEVIKLITAQYVPFDDTFVYNGINCTTSSFKI